MGRGKTGFCRAAKGVSNRHMTTLSDVKNLAISIAGWLIGSIAGWTILILIILVALALILTAVIVLIALSKALIGVLL